MKVLEEEKKQLLTLVAQRRGPVDTPLATPSRVSVSRSSFSQFEPNLNFTSRSVGGANNVIHKLKRRVSFASRSRLSFHMKSAANLSIYRVDEVSNESPEMKSSEKERDNKVEVDDETRRVGSRGRASSSFYFHANNLSVWQNPEA